MVVSKNEDRGEREHSATISRLQCFDRPQGETKVNLQGDASLEKW